MRFSNITTDTASKLVIGQASDTDNIQHGFTARLSQESRYDFGRKSLKNVTASFTAASKELKPGQLVKDEYFPLFDAVSALEIMDPKMDSGFVPPGDKGIEFDVSGPMSAEEAIWLMDQLVCLEMAWHQGYPLSQTLFRSLHIDRLLSPENRYPYTFFENQHDQKRTDLSLEENITHRLVRVYCLATIKSAESVLELMQSQSWYGEEDFVAHVFGRDLLPRITVDDVNDWTEDALEFLSLSRIDEHLRSSLQARLLLRKGLMLNFADCPPRERKNKWRELATPLADVNKTHNSGSPLHDALSDSVQRHLATNAPPRPAISLDWDTAYKQWVKLLDDLEVISELTGFWIRQSPHCLKRALWTFSERCPHAYSNAKMQFVILDSGLVAGDVQHIDLFLTDIRDLVLAGSELADPASFQVELTSDHRHRTSRILEDFMDKAFDEYLILYRAICQNRSRTRRLFTQAIHVWEELEKAASETDQKLSKISPQPVLADQDGTPMTLSPLNYWARYQKLQVMEWCVQLGFEFDIYFPDELGQMYWYLCNLIQKRVDVLERNAEFLRHRMMLNTSAGNTAYVAQTLASDDWTKSLLLTAHATGMLAASISRLWRLLVALRVVEPPLRPYATSQLWYEARMKPYICTSDPPSMMEFTKSRRVDEPVQDSFLFIQESNKETRNDLQQLKQTKVEHLKCVGTHDEWKIEMKQLETTIVAINVQTHLLKGLCEKHGIKQSIGGKSLKGLVDISIPAVGKRYHKWWIVPQLKEKP